MVEIVKNMSPSGTLIIDHTNATYQSCGYSLEEMIERRNAIITQLALSPTKSRKPKEKTLQQLILETPSSELPELLKKMGLLTTKEKEKT